MNISPIELPVVRNLQESRELASMFAAILTVGPEEREVRWKHDNHKVLVFGDTTSGHGAPTFEQIAEAVEWGKDQNDLLVHCHAGMSRSTATAWGISIARGADPLDSFLALKEAQPQSEYRGGRGREFIPNNLIVKHLEKFFNLKGLVDIRKEHATSSGWY